jgi:hypothetical protein
MMQIEENVDMFLKMKAIPGQGLVINRGILT